MAKNSPSMATSDFNLQKLTTKELSENISATIKLGGSIMVVGRRGSGKTEIAKQQIASNDMLEVYLNLSTLERVDMGGYPNIMGNNASREFVNFLLPQFFEAMIDEKALKGKKGVVALLDEVDKADPSLWAPLLEFVQFRSINGRKLPHLQAVIMTGNLLSEGGSRPSLPLLDRAEKFLVEPDYSSWLAWAAASGKVHASVLAYLNDNPEDLFGAPDPEDRFADPSPRGWAGASELITKGEEMGLSYDLLNKKVAGRIGKEIGLKYSHYFSHYQVLLPIVDQIFAGKAPVKKFEALEPSKKLICSMIVCSRLANQLDEAHREFTEKSKTQKNVKLAAHEPPSLSHVGKFLNVVDEETVLVTVRNYITIKRLVDWKLDDHVDWKVKLDGIIAKMGG
jgi:hypothetical protein